MHKKCAEECKKVEIKKSISGYEYDENIKSFYLCDKINSKAIRGRYEHYENAIKLSIKHNYCVSDSDFNDDNHCAIDVCDIDAKECRHEMLIKKN